MAESFAFKRIYWSLVRDGTRFRAELEGHPEGCFLSIPDYVRQVLDGNSSRNFGVWIPSREVS
jgi:hypothetical protein